MYVIVDFGFQGRSRNQSGEVNEHDGMCVQIIDHGMIEKKAKSRKRK
jgi:hypothetical protein